MKFLNLLLDPLSNFQRSSLQKNVKLANCEIKCSLDHICDGSRYSNQRLNVLLYSFLVVLGRSLFSSATMISTSIGFETLHHSNLFGRQRVWGTIGSGITALSASRLYAHWKTDYVYIFPFIIISILTILITCFIHFPSDQSKKAKLEDDDAPLQQKLNDLSNNENKEKAKRKSLRFNIRALIPLLKKIDVIVFLSTTFIWGMSFSALDPVS